MTPALSPSEAIPEAVAGRKAPDLVAFVEQNRQRLLPLSEATVFRARELFQLAQKSEVTVDYVQKAAQMLQLAEDQLERLSGGQPTKDPQHWYTGPLHRLTLACHNLQVREGKLGNRPTFAAVLQRIAELVRSLSADLRHLFDEQAGTPAEPGSPALLPAVWAAPAARLPEAAAHPDARPGRILLVDDDADACDELAAFLRDQGHHADCCSRGHDAQHLLAQPAYDLILLDVVMPKMDGLELLKWIRRQPHLRSVAVLMLSGLGERSATIDCIEAGADDYLHKPIHVELLDVKIRSALQRRRMRLRELEQFFPSAVARQLLDRPQSLEEGKVETVTVLFCDIRGFSRICGRLKDPARIIRWVSEVMEILAGCVVERQGVIVDFQGDSLMATWGVPEPQDNHAELACRAALDMFARLELWNRSDSPYRPPEPTLISVGIHTGKAWVGNTGTSRKMKYGPLGDTVNTASRIQGATKYLKANLIISHATWKRVQQLFATRRLAWISAVNIERPLRVHEIDCTRTPNWSLQKRYYEKALRLYEDRRLEEASMVLGRLLRQKSGTGPVLAMMARVLNAMTDPDQWSRVYPLPGK